VLRALHHAQADAFICFLQLCEADLLPTTFATLPAPAERELPRVGVTKLKLPEARLGKVANEHYAIIGSTLLLRQCPLASQPALRLPQGRDIELPASSGVKLPRLEAVAECRQAPPSAATSAAAPR
jgi:hypothetical protein